jgi:hypothetical protein
MDCKDEREEKSSGKPHRNYLFSRITPTATALCSRCGKFRTRLLRLSFRLERLRQRCELTFDVFEKESLLKDFGHLNFIARGLAVHYAGKIACTWLLCNFAAHLKNPPHCSLTQQDSHSSR